MVTANAAKATAVGDVIGTLATGQLADIAIFDGSKNADYRAVIAAEPQDVVLVMRGGKVLYGDRPWSRGDRRSPRATRSTSAAPSKQVCLTGRDRQDVPRALGRGAAASTPRSSAARPTNEPSCVPVAPGVGERLDRLHRRGHRDRQRRRRHPRRHRQLPDRLQPDPAHGQRRAARHRRRRRRRRLRPLPARRQHHDLHARSTPTTSTATACPTRPTTAPPCPTPSQTDTDGDGKGDACDACPIAANPGNQALPGDHLRHQEGRGRPPAPRSR